MMTITPNNECLTLINVFTVDPSNQQNLLNLLAKATETVRQAPGFISSALHKSFDGRQVAMYAQWRNMDDYQNMRENSEAATFLTRALELSTFQPGMYAIENIFISDNNIA